MHTDLIWLAQNESEWRGGTRYSHIYLLGDNVISYCTEKVAHIGDKTFTRAEYQAAQETLK